MATCRECWARVEVESMDEYGLSRCPKCNAFFLPRKRSYVFVIVCTVLIVAMVLWKNFVDPVTSVDASAGWHLRHD
jgi:DNA-directed RNA polymerase subunit RPC12/RpoP